jgi:hypothetical protein
MRNRLARKPIRRKPQQLRFTKEEPVEQPIEQPLEKPETAEKMDPPETQETTQNSTIESNNSFSSQSQADPRKTVTHQTA